MRIACLIATLESGGAERVLVTLANAWIGAGHDVDILTLEEPGASTVFILDDRVRLQRLGVKSENRRLWRRGTALFHRLASLRKALRRLRPDVLLCFIAGTNVLGLVTARGLGCPVVISERVHPAHHRLRWPIPLLRRIFYPWATALVVQTEDIAAWFRGRLRLDPVVIPNPIDIDRFGPRTVPDGRKLLVSVGRLNGQKGYDTLIAAFALLAAVYPDWDLVIYGEGPERRALEALVARNNLTGRVMLPGVVDDVPDRLASASLYVQPSRYEGFPNAIVEALAAGCPVVATDAPGATAEILDYGDLGALVPAGDGDALSSALEMLMADPAARDAYSRRARAGAARYEIGSIAERWTALFTSLR